MIIKNGENRSVAALYPDLLAEWSDENTLSPEEVSCGSNKKVIWHAGCGHTWEASVKNRVHGSGCPFCSGNRILKGFNDLASYDSVITVEWSEKNLPLRPEDVARHSPRSVWWECHTCGHMWKARIADRVDGGGCPMCAGHFFKPGVNDLQSEHPEIVDEWSERDVPADAWSGEACRTTKV